MPTLTAALIVRDEAAHITDCLESITPHVDAVVVVDTGSVDDTVERARAAGARVLSTPWRDDFAAARNVALDAVETPWALVIDADERLEVVADLELGAWLAAQPSPNHAWVPILSVGESGRVEESSFAIRLLRVDQGLRFRYPVHEQIDTGEGEGIDAPCRILHLGHVDAAAASVRQAYYARLLEVLPEDDPHRLLFGLRDHVNHGRWPAVLDAARRFVALGQRSPADALVRFYGALAANNLGDLEAAAAWVRDGLTCYPEHPDLRLVAMTLDARHFTRDLAAISAPGHPMRHQLGETRHLAPLIQRFLAALGAGE